MNLPALILSAYFAIGLSLMIVMLDRSGREQRARGEAGPEGRPRIEVGRLIFIALLWPIWLLFSRTRGRKRSKSPSSSERGK